MTLIYSDPLTKLYHGDMTTEEFEEPHPFDLVVTSPPYDLGKEYGNGESDRLAYNQWMDRMYFWTQRCNDLLRDGGRLCLNIPLDTNTQFTQEGRKRSVKTAVYSSIAQMAIRETSFIYNTTILWLERNVSRRTAWGSWLSASDPWVNTAAEVILVLSKRVRKRPADGRTTDIEKQEFMDWTLGLWDFPGESARRVKHPSPFPEELPRRLIKLFGFTDDVVGDPFVGSGTTCVAAKKLGRKSIGVDMERSFLVQAASRLSKTHPTYDVAWYGGIDGVEEAS